MEGVTAVPPDISLVEAVNALFGGHNVYVLYEAQELAMTALTEPKTRQLMIDSVVEMLQPAQCAYDERIKTPGDDELYSGASEAAKSYFGNDGVKPPASILQQVASCRLTWSFLKNKEERRLLAIPDVCKRMVDCGIVISPHR